MNLASSVGAGWADSLTVLSQDDDRVLCRGWRNDADGERTAVLAVVSASEHPTPSFVGRLAHEYGLRDDLDGGSAVRPLALVRVHGGTALLLDDPGGEPLERFIGRPMETGRFLRLAVGLAAALGQLHQRGLIHKDIKPANALVDATTGRVWLTGFGIASRLPREHQSPEPPELIAGTLAYMAPEQTGRMNRSIDSRSDLYSLGVTLYEMLTGALPFTASDPMEWVHCHIARQPVPPAERSKGLPETLSAIISKLLAKTAEERYQTAAGVESDLRRCLVQWERERRIDDFSPGEHDTSDRLLIPEKLYGRSREIDTLLAAFARVVAHGLPELVLVSGYSGIGKSSVVNELHKALVPSRGLFAAGKFDQYKRDIPYATLAQAFQALIHRLLGKSNSELQSWRERLEHALHPNGALIVNLVPELKLIIGAQPPVPDLPSQDAQNRFQLALRRFISVFARPEHPLVLFLDDLQWLDTATLELLQRLLVAQEVRHLLIVGAYRGNEVSLSHPLVQVLDAIHKAGVPVREIVLKPLGQAEVSQLVGDAMHCEPERVRPLVQLVHDKTGGNPFFAIQFFLALAEEGLLAFDPTARTWQWNMDRIRAKSYTDNVVDLMAEKLKRLSSATQDTLKLLACLGNVALTANLALVQGTTEEAMHAALWEAVHAGLVFREDGAYKFLHDRIQQAAYALIPQEQRAQVHLRIGRALLAGMPADQLAEHLFDVANQFNRSATRLINPDEKAQVASIELRAGLKAKASTAYASACVYLAAGMALIGVDGLDDRNRYALAFALGLERAECELLSGSFDEAERLIDQLIAGAASRVDKAAAYSLKIDLHLIKSEKPEGVAAGLECLRLFGIDMHAHPTEAEVQAEFEVIWRNLGERPIESLLDLPSMTDLEMRAAMRVLAFLTGPALYTDINLYHLHFCKMVNLSLQYGGSDAASFGYAGFGVILCQPFGRYGEGYRFAKLACDLVEKHAYAAYKAKVYLAAEMAALWTHPIEVGIQLVRSGLRAGGEMGDLSFASFCCMHLLTDLLIQGAHLDEVWKESEACLDFVRKARYLDAADAIISQRQFIRNLRGQTAAFSTFTDNNFDEASFEARLTENRMTPMVSRYWILKVQARFISGDYRTGLVAAEQARKLHWSSEAFLHSLDYYYYAALTMAACYDDASAKDQEELRALLTAHERKLRTWAENYSPTFADKHALVAAEIARIEGRDGDAMRDYEQAIRSANENGFVQNEGLAYEVAARFYASRGFDSIANAYLRNARYCYVRWGAYGKVRQLDRLYPHLTATEGVGSTATIGSQIQQLDLAAFIKASQALSSEIVMPKLIERLMRIALENAGADRGLLMLPARDDQLIQAEAQATGDQIEVVLLEKPIGGNTCPESLVRYVIRTHESVLLDDTSRPNLFSEDDYLRGREAKSILCVPLLKQGRLTGLLYLENTLASYAFTPNRTAVLELLAAQAAISLENTRLYGELQEREAKVRRLIDANIIGISVWDFEGRIIEANEAFLDIVGYSRDDLVSDRVHWTALTPSEWSDAVGRSREELMATGSCKPYEKEYFRKDGTRVPVLIGAATFGERRDQGVAFVLDLTERKRAEEERQVQLWFLESMEKVNQAIHGANDLEQMASDVLEAVLSIFACDRAWLVYPCDPEAPSWRATMEHCRPEYPGAFALGVDLLMDAEVGNVFRAARASSGAVQFGATSEHPVPAQLAERFGIQSLIGIAVYPKVDQPYMFGLHQCSYPRVWTAREERLLRVVGVRLGDALTGLLMLRNLRESENRLAEAQRIAHFGHWELNLDTDRYGMSDEMGRIFGLRPQEQDITRAMVRELIHPEDLERVTRAAMRAEDGGPPYDEEFRVVRPNGEVRIVHSRAGVMRDESGRPRRMFGTIQDVTEGKQAEENLRASERRYREAQTELAHVNRVATMGQLTASIAHEVKQPITAAITSADAGLRWLAARPPDLEEVRNAFDDVVRAGNRAGEVVDRIRALIKKVPARNASLDINETILETIALTRPEMLRHRVVLETELADGLPHVWGDRVQLQQVILNLIMNAIEAMSEVSEGSRELLIGASVNAPDGVVVAVRDSGPGLTPESLKHLFDPFYTTKPAGMGMGLSICRSITEAHGGRLWTSANSPRGAVFQFALPATGGNTSREHMLSAAPNRND